MPRTGCAAFTGNPESGACFFKGFNGTGGSLELLLLDNKRLSDDDDPTRGLSASSDL